MPIASNTQRHIEGSTETEVAEILGKDMKTIYRWMKKGKVKYQKLGATALISEEELKRLQTERESRVLVQNTEF